MGIANELITRGWTQGGAVDQYGHVCLLGALNAFVYGDPLTSFGGLQDQHKEDVWCLARHMLNRALGYDHSIAAWNDQPGRTFDEVLRVAKQADEELGW